MSTQEHVRPAEADGQETEFPKTVMPGGPEVPDEKTRAEKLREIDLFVLDLDGTFYLGDRLIDGALDFVNDVWKRGKKILFFTNNSSRSPKVYMERLAGMGCPISRDQIMTSGDVTIAYLRETYPGKTVYLVGTPALEESFRQEGICLWDCGDAGPRNHAESVTRDRTEVEPRNQADAGQTDMLPASRPDIVVIGFDTTLTYEKLERACTYIREGAVFLATHLDINCPTEYGFMPDCGAICAAVTLSTGVEPKYLGKPFQETVDMVLLRTGVSRERVAFVGDRLYTDVAVGVNHGAKGFLVLSGETKLEDIKNSQVKPDEVYGSLGEMNRLLCGGTQDGRTAGNDPGVWREFRK